MKPLRWTVMATQVPAGGNLGGVVRYTTEIIRALARREDVTVCALATRSAADTVRDLIGPDAVVRTVPDAPVALLSLAERYAPLPVLLGGSDVVHGVKHLVPVRSRALRVLTVHDMLLLDRPADFGLAKRLLLPTPYRASIRDADLLLCVSDATRARLQAHDPSSRQRSEVVHLATSPSLHSATSRPVRALAGRRFAVVVGDSSPRKNLATLLSAWPAVRAQLPDAVLAVAGPPNWARTPSGPLFDQLVDSGAVVALGHIDDAELRWAYENAGVVLCPSLAEGFGLPAAEALEFGAPVLVSDDAALQEVSAGRARAVVAATDVAGWARAVIDVLGVPAGEQGARRAVAGGRTWDQVAAETVAAVRRTLAERMPVST